MARITKKNLMELQIFLLSWFASNGRKFPWRKSKLTNYQIIIAETLLQRTQAETVAPFYSKFILAFPNWNALSNQKIKSIENYLKPIGLYRQKAKKLKRLAIEMQKRNGRLSKDRKDLEAIPFLGQYIVNSIELIIFKQPSPLLDVNMARLLERYFHKRKMADIRYDSYLQNISRELVNHPRSKELNWAILDYSALICKARKPLCSECGLKGKCTFGNYQFNS